MTAWITADDSPQYSSVPGEFGDDFGGLNSGPAVAIGDAIIEAASPEDLRTLITRIADTIPAGAALEPPAAPTPEEPNGPLTPAQALAQIAALTRIEHPWGPLLKRDLEEILDRVRRDDPLSQIGQVVADLPAEPPTLDPASYAAWRAERSGALRDIENILARPAR